jgi:hypothetical protein
MARAASRKWERNLRFRDNRFVSFDLKAECNNAAGMPPWNTLSFYSAPDGDVRAELRIPKTRFL